jgi:hypothetical protein
MESGLKKQGASDPAFFTLEKRLWLIKYSYGGADRARSKQMIKKKPNLF